MKIENWAVDEYVTWDEYSTYCNHSFEFVERNRLKYAKVPAEHRCAFCNKPLSGNRYKMLYAEIQTGEYDDRGSSTHYYNTPKEGRIPIKIGLTCARAFELAHSHVYNKE